VPNYAQFLATLNLGMKEGFESQTRAQRQGDFAHNSIACVSKIEGKSFLLGEKPEESPCVWCFLVGEEG
jgi:hypothetical protein